MFRFHPLGEIADVTGESARFLGECGLSLGELRLLRSGLGRALDVTLSGNQLREPPQKLPHLLLFARQPLVAIPRLQQCEQFAQRVERVALAGACLEQLPLLEQLHDRVEAVAHLRIPRLFKDAAQQRGPPRIAGGQQVGKPQECLFKVAKLLRQFLLARGQATGRRRSLHRRLRGRILRSRCSPAPRGHHQEKAQRDHQPAPIDEIPIHKIRRC